jgi:hypothetical protein
MDERQFFRESQTSKPARLVCPFCGQEDNYDLRWMVRRKKERPPPGADERDRAKFAKSASYMVLMDDRVSCRNMRCRKGFEVSGVKSTAFLTD